MGSQKNRQKAIGFQIVDCSRCGADRVLGQPCAECKMKPRSGEVNSLVVQRRTAVARVQEALLDQSVIADQAGPGIPTYEELNTYLDDFVDALGRLISDPISSDSIARMVEVQRHLRGSSVDALPTLASGPPLPSTRLSLGYLPISRDFGRRTLRHCERRRWTRRSASQVRVKTELMLRLLS